MFLFKVNCSLMYSKKSGSLFIAAASSCNVFNVDGGSPVILVISPRRAKILNISIISLLYTNANRLNTPSLVFVRDNPSNELIILLLRNNYIISFLYLNFLIVDTNSNIPYL